MNCGLTATPYFVLTCAASSSAETSPSSNIARRSASAWFIAPRPSAHELARKATQDYAALRIALASISPGRRPCPEPARRRAGTPASAPPHRSGPGPQPHDGGHSAPGRSTGLRRGPLSPHGVRVGVAEGEYRRRPHRPVV